MYARQSLPRSLSRLLLVQDGVVSRAQTDAAGVGRSIVRRLVAEGTWSIIESGLYAEAHRIDEWSTRAWAGVLIGGEGSMLWRRSAAPLLGLTDRRELPIELLVPADRKRVPRSWLELTRTRDLSRRVAGGGPPHSRVEDTVLDLCAVGDEEGVITWMTRAVQRRRTSPAALRRALDARHRQPNRRLILELIEDTADGVHTHLERRYKYGVEHAHGLPLGSRQSAGTAGVHDVHYRAYGLVVELDGERWHRDRQRQDRRRDNVTADEGVLTYRFGWPEVTDGACETARLLARALRRRGWTGPETVAGLCVCVSGW